MAAARVILGAAIAVLACAPASAHHSTAAYDQTKQITLEGTVKKFAWTNPHMFILLIVNTPAGPKEWTVEAGTPSVNVRNGWKPNSIKAGDKVSILVNPARAGTPDAQAAVVTFPDGRKLVAPGGAPGGAPPS